MNEELIREVIEALSESDAKVIEFILENHTSTEKLYEIVIQYLLTQMIEDRYGGYGLYE